MKKTAFTALVAAVFLLSAFTIRKSLAWEVKEGYSVKFTSKDPSGVFTKMNADILFDENDLAGAHFDVKIDVNSINTGNGMQNKHAKSDKWFDAAKYPEIRFMSKKFTKTTAGYTVSGTMEVHGVKKDYEIPFTFKNNTFQASFPVNRTDFNIGKPGGKVPDVLTVEVAVPVTKK